MSANETNLRRMNIEDYDDAYRLWTSTPGMGLNDVDDSRDGIARYLNCNPSTCFIYEDNGAIVGTILAGHDGRRGFIYHTCVAKSHRKRGIGRELVSASMDALKDAGITKAALVVFAKNETGNAFWQSLGFVLRRDISYRNKPIAQLNRLDV